MSKIINGKAISQEIRREISDQVRGLSDAGVVPTLAVIIVGDDAASKVYVNNKKKACEEVGITSLEYVLPESTTNEELQVLIHELNERKDVNGILVQLPMPCHLDEKLIIESIDSTKDVDAFNEKNVGKIATQNFTFLPCTPAGVMEILHHEGIEISGKHCVVIGRSNIVGKPLSMLMLHKDATVTICHSKTRDLPQICKLADIVVCAVGRAKFLNADMVKPGAVVIDVGINRGVDGKLCGDVDFDNVKQVASCITPVPGGVGPMTITMLMKNTVTATKLQNGITKI